MPGSDGADQPGGRRCHGYWAGQILSYACEDRLRPVILLWRIEGLADRFLYFNDDMMFVGPVEPTDFFSSQGKVVLRGRWSKLERGARKRKQFQRPQQTVGR
jgi:hypothetical protein